MLRTLSELKAWQLLEKAFKKAHREGSNFADILYGVAAECLCGAISNLSGVRITYAVAVKMNDRIESYAKSIGKHAGDFLFDANAEGSLQRSKFCAKQAKQIADKAARAKAKRELAKAGVKPKASTSNKATSKPAAKTTSKQRAKTGVR